MNEKVNICSSITTSIHLEAGRVGKWEKLSNNSKNGLSAWSNPGRIIQETQDQEAKLFKTGRKSIQYNEMYCNKLGRIHPKS